MKISSAEFLELVHSVDTLRWQLPVIEKTTGGRGSLFGGVGLAAGIVALEQASKKPIIWATGQYLSLTQQPVMLDLEVILPAVGRSVTQGRVVGHLGDQEVITILGACGTRPDLHEGIWTSMPDAPRPEDCVDSEREMESESLHRHVDIRMARGMFGFSGEGTATNDGQSLFWARMPGVRHDAAALAIMADYMPSCIGTALGKVIGCTSLDNTIRYANVVESEWILCDNRVEFIGNGFAYGTVHMWSDTGILLATASQSMIVREMK